MPPDSLCHVFVVHVLVMVVVVVLLINSFPNLYLPSAPASVAKRSVRFPNIGQTECRECGGRELPTQATRAGETVPLPR